MYSMPVEKLWIDSLSESLQNLMSWQCVLFTVLCTLTLGERCVLDPTLFRVLCISEDADYCGNVEEMCHRTLSDLFEELNSTVRRKLSLHGCGIFVMRKWHVWSRTVQIATSTDVCKESACSCHPYRCLQESAGRSRPVIEVIAWEKTRSRAWSRGWCHAIVPEERLSFLSSLYVTTPPFLHLCCLPSAGYTVYALYCAVHLL